MDKNSKCFGIDISKSTFDVVNSDGTYASYANDYSGFRSFFSQLGNADYCVMEATGYYHYRLA